MTFIQERNMWLLIKNTQFIHKCFFPQQMFRYRIKFESGRFEVTGMTGFIPSNLLFIPNRELFHFFFFCHVFILFPMPAHHGSRVPASISTSDQRCLSDVENEAKSDVRFSKLHNVHTTSVSNVETTLV